MQTESDANKTRCLFLELIQAVRSSVAPGGPEGPVGCIGSGCAHWRWDIDRMTDSDEQNGRRFTHGYCGLAGAPQ